MNILKYKKMKRHIKLINKDNTRFVFQINAVLLNIPFIKVFWKKY